MSIINFDENGNLSTTNRDTILQNLIQRFKAIYGQNVYIDKGTVDYDMLSLLADLFSDMGNVAISVANGLNLTTAVGTQLDNLATIYYGTISRKPATKSTVGLVLTGNPNVTIYNGQVRDAFGGIWNLPNVVTIPTTGTTNVTATYSQTGPYYIDANQISGLESIVTPIAGWTGVSQPSECFLGSNVETDMLFRNRLAQKAQGESFASLDTLYSRLLGLNTMQRVRLYENDTSSSLAVRDDLTIPSHSITAVCEYNNNVLDDSEVAQTIYDFKGTGVGTFAPDDAEGVKSIEIETGIGTQTVTVEFIKATYKYISVAIVLKKINPNAPDITSDTTLAIQNAILNKVLTFQLGATIYAEDFYLPIIEALNENVGENFYVVSRVYFPELETETDEYPNSYLIPVFNAPVTRLDQVYVSIE